MARKVIDISIPLQNGMPQYPGQNPVDIAPMKTLDKDGVFESAFVIHSHAGTHIDAPSHFVKGGRNVEDIDLSKLLGPCKVLDVTKSENQEIMPEDFSPALIEQGDRILFKTKNSLGEKRDFEKFVSLSLETVKLLAEKGVVLIGTDFFGVEKRRNPGHPVHMAILEKEIVLLEGLDLSKAGVGEYDFVCLPILIPGADAAPCRAVLITNE